MLNISLPDAAGRLADHAMSEAQYPEVAPSANPARIAFAAAHVVADPLADLDPSGSPAIDWAATMAFRRHLSGLGLGIAEAMDTAQRGMGLNWESAIALIRETRRELPDALVFNGAGTDHLPPGSARTLGDVEGAYLQQIGAIQRVGGRIILMASRELCRVAGNPDEFRQVYGTALAACDRPAILHWLGDMFDPQLSGYWGSHDLDSATETVLDVISENLPKVDGIKVSLLDRDREILMRRRLPPGVRIYTGDDFNYPELIAGDGAGYSDALLGIFDPLAPIAARALSQLADGDAKGFREILDPTVPLARTIFREPTRHYKSGVVLLAWLNGFQDHFIMVNGAQAMRPLPYYAEVFRLADACGLFRDPERAVHRMRQLLAVYGIT